MFVNAPHPLPSRHQHINPYGRYWWLGPGEEGRGAAWADAGAHERAEVRGKEQGGMPGTDNKPVTIQGREQMQG